MPLFLFMLLALSSSERVSVWNKPPEKTTEKSGMPSDAKRRDSSVSGPAESRMSAARATKLPPIDKGRASFVPGTAGNVTSGRRARKKSNNLPMLETAPKPQAQCCSSQKSGTALNAKRRTSSVSGTAGSGTSAGRARKCKCSSDPAGSGRGTGLPAGNGKRDVRHPSDSADSGGGTGFPAGSGLAVVRHSKAANSSGQADNRGGTGLPAGKGSSSDTAEIGGDAEHSRRSENQPEAKAHSSGTGAEQDDTFESQTKLLGSGGNAYVLGYINTTDYVLKAYDSQDDRNKAVEQILALPEACGKHFAGLACGARNKLECMIDHKCVHMPDDMENWGDCYYMKMINAGNKNIEACFSYNETDNGKAKEFVNAAITALRCFHEKGFVHYDYQWKNLVTTDCDPRTVKMVDLDCSYHLSDEDIGCEMYRDYAKLIGYENFDYGSRFGEFEIAKTLREKHQDILTNKSDVEELREAILS
eukprot:CAMPEP_0117486634 /NCGR_PEP_ID=MMETSP0784-20121206/15579_1 /TAXON_ID=39447 /ORGANISM="" /LENGTH=473 /DNA_ID=CAMNT_0005281253 /DNA_START=80 /DNA_END=1501 /DNA_ORIENTATION=-